MESEEQRVKRRRRKVINFMRYVRRMRRIDPKWGYRGAPYFKFLNGLDAAK